MALLNPVYGLIVPFLFIVTVPLAILAGITTTLAFSLLIFRAGLVYIDIVVNMVPQYVAGRPVYPLFGRSGGATVSSIPATSATAAAAAAAASSNLQQASPVSMSSSSTATAGGLEHHAIGGQSPTAASRQQQVVVARNNHRRRRTSAASFISMGGSSTPPDENSLNNNNNNNNNNKAGGSSSSKRSSFMVPSSVGMDRDFEGVGGWRLNGRPAHDGGGDDDDGGGGGGGDDDDDDDDYAWTHINSRLSLPLMEPLWRHHHRSPSTPGGGGGCGAGGEVLMMRSPSSGLTSEERMAEHGGKRGRERRGEKDGGVPRAGDTPPARSRVRTPTRMIPPLTSMDGTDGSYFPRVVSPRAEKRSMI